MPVLSRRLFLALLATLPAACGAPRRPQDPVTRPYPHHEVQISGLAGPLAGELVLPPAPMLAPAVLLLAGSGPQDRDERVAGHRPFLVLSDALARAGIASLRYDKRGVGASAGDFASATISDFAADAGAAVDWLAQHPGIDAGRIALLGHSEGGLTAPLAARGRDVAGLVLMAGPALPMEHVIHRQTRVIAALDGSDTAELARLDRALAEAFAALRAAPEAAPGIARALAPLPAPVRRNFRGLLASNWAHDAIRHDPLAEIAAFRGPVLGLFGGRDTQVDASQNAGALQQIAPAHPDLRILTYPGLNHLFQPGTTGHPQDYARTAATIAPEVIQDILDFLHRMPAVTDAQLQKR